jgi:hypothetical protein
MDGQRDWLLPPPSLATFRRKNGISGGTRVVPDRSGALPECALLLSRAFSVLRGKFCFPRVPFGFIHPSDLPKLFLY